MVIRCNAHFPHSSSQLQNNGAVNLPYVLVKTFAESILQGNMTYSRLARENLLVNVNLNIPEALAATFVQTGYFIEEWVCAAIYLLFFFGQFKNIFLHRKILAPK